MASSSFSLDSENLEEIASGLHRKNTKNTKTETNTTTTKKKCKNNESFPLTKCWRHVLWADDVRLLLSAQGEIKSKASIIIYHGGGEKEWRGDHLVFRVTGGSSHSYQGTGGELQNIDCQWKGSLKNYDFFFLAGGTTRLISVWYNKNPPIPSPGNIYVVTGPKHSKACMDGSSQKKILSTFARLNWNLECWYFAERGKLEDPEKTPGSKDKSQQWIQSTCDARSKIWTQFTVVGEGGAGRGGREALSPLHHPCFHNWSLKIFN